MRILQLIDHMGTGGAQENVLEISESLGVEHEFHLATLFGPDRYAERSESTFSGHVHRLQSGSRYTNIGVLDPRPTMRLRNLIRSNEFDVVHAHLYVAPLALLAARRELRLGGTRIVVSTHAERSTLPWHVFQAFRATRSLVDLYVTPDRDVTPRDLATVGIDQRRIRYAPYCISPPAVPEAAQLSRVRRELATDETFNILSAARLHGQRHIDKFLATVAALPPTLSGRSVQLLVAGDGPLERELRDQSERLGISDRVRFLGRRDDVTALMLCSDAYLTMSVRGMVGVAGMEALWCKIPTVAWEHESSDTCAGHDLEPWLPCPTVDTVGDMTALVERIGTEPEVRRRLVDHGADYVTKFRSIAAMKDAWSTHYADVVSSRA